MISDKPTHITEEFRNTFHLADIDVQNVLAQAGSLFAIISITAVRHTLCYTLAHYT